jgi:F0F1-type ATP synthase assembly protein I
MKSPKKQPNKWLQLINIPFQMGVTIVVFNFIGEWLDKKYLNTNKLLATIFTLLGVFVALYNVVAQVNKLNKDE